MLTKWDPFQDMLSLRNIVDRMFEDFYGGERQMSRTSTWGLALDLAENEDEFTVKASLPGINADDIDITYTENTLTIKGEIKEEGTWPLLTRRDNTQGCHSGAGRNLLRS